MYNKIMCDLAQFFRCVTHRVDFSRARNIRYALCVSLICMFDLSRKIQWREKFYSLRFSVNDCA